MGLVGPMDIVDNMMIRSYKKGGFFWADRRSPRTLAEHIIDELQVVTPGVNTPVGKLSGGNVQKVLVGSRNCFESGSADGRVSGARAGHQFLVYDLQSPVRAKTATALQCSAWAKIWTC